MSWKSKVMDKERNCVDYSDEYNGTGVFFY